MGGYGKIEEQTLNDETTRIENAKDRAIYPGRINKDLLLDQKRAELYSGILKNTNNLEQARDELRQKRRTLNQTEKTYQDWSNMETQQQAQQQALQQSKQSAAGERAVTGNAKAKLSFYQQRLARSNAALDDVNSRVNKIIESKQQLYDKTHTAPEYDETDAASAKAVEAWQTGRDKIASDVKARYQKQIENIAAERKQRYIDYEGAAKSYQGRIDPQPKYSPANQGQIQGQAQAQGVQGQGQNGGLGVVNDDAKAFQILKQARDSGHPAVADMSDDELLQVMEQNRVK
jgi:hypothetical protein